MYYWHRSSGILYCYTCTVATIPCLITRTLYISKCISRAENVRTRETARFRTRTIFIRPPECLLHPTENVFRPGDDNKTGRKSQDKATVFTTRLYGGQEPRSGALAADNADRSGQTSVMRTTSFNSWLFGVVAEGHCLLCGAWLSQARIPTACPAKIP